MLSKLFNTDPHKQFWEWFETNANAIAAVRSGSDPILQKITGQLLKVHPNLEFEMGLSNDNQLEFIISANGIKSVFPVVEQLVSCAPKLPNWKIIAFRQPKGFTSEILYDNFLLKNEDVWFSYKDQMDKVHLMIYIRNLSSGNAEQAIGASFIYLDNMLGEHFVATKIGLIDHQPLPDDPQARGLQPLSRIREIILKK